MRFIFDRSSRVEGRFFFFFLTINRSIPSRVSVILRKDKKKKRLHALCNLLPLPRYYPCLLLHIHSGETTEVNISCDLCGIKLHVTKASALKAIYPIAFSFFLQRDQRTRRRLLTSVNIVVVSHVGHVVFIITRG